jgi:ribose-phosphate pyrophosphokinase
MVLCHKTRERANVIGEMRVIGEVKGKNVILIDDIVDTAGTLTKAAGLMKDEGALSVRAISSHAVMSDPATQRVEDSVLSELIMTDSIPFTRASSKVKILSIADLFADTIERVFDHRSISSQYLI